MTMKTLTNVKIQVAALNAGRTATGRGDMRQDRPSAFLSYPTCLAGHEPTTPDGRLSGDRLAPRAGRLGSFGARPTVRWRVSKRLASAPCRTKA